MGLLDDAIREHLELKRLKGDDPGDVARQEHEALGPVRREAGRSHDDGQTPIDDDRDGGVAEALAMPGNPANEPSSHGAGQETVEINMEAELSAEAAANDPVQAGRARSADHPDAPTSSGESLEWEMPGDQAADKEPAGEADADEDQVEDVLEETPDFLRETPEHERLWFEQRPPRDFDFNE